MQFPMLLAPCLLLLGSATTDDPTTQGQARPWDGQVQVYGALRAMMHEGQTQAMVGLDALLPNPDLVAVGALADLAGELTVVAGQAYLSYPEGADASRTESTPTTDAAAALLVAAEVPAWQSLVSERAIAFDQLDAEIAKLAATAGMDLDARIPFLLEGSFENLQWHVIDGRRLGDGGSSHQDHLTAAVRMQRERASATLIGFYSPRDQGVFTHMGSNTHLHCVVTEPLSAGHVDRVDIPAGTTIRFPLVVNAELHGATQREGASGH